MLIEDFTTITLYFTIDYMIDYMISSRWSWWYQGKRDIVNDNTYNNDFMMPNFLPASVQILRSLKRTCKQRQSSSDTFRGKDSNFNFFLTQNFLTTRPSKSQTIWEYGKRIAIDNSREIIFSIVKFNLYAYSFMYVSHYNAKHLLYFINYILVLSWIWQ